MEKEKAFISTPMRDKTQEEITKSIARATDFLSGKGYDVVYSYDPVRLEIVMRNGIPNPNLYMLGQSFMKMAECEAVYFCKGWDHSVGCRLEHDAAFDYGLDIYFEEEIS